MNVFFTNVAYASESLDAFISNVDRLIINPIIILLFALAVVYFLWGIFEFISNTENEEARTIGKKHMLFGVIGIFIMIAVWSILSIIMNTLNITGINPKEGTVELQDYNPSNPNPFLKD
ncbi:MAG: hypothetical protein V4504_00935 [Patescibacteria group bacterium]